MKAEIGWKIAVVCIGLGVIACGAGIAAQRKALDECRIAVSGQKAELEMLKSGIQARQQRGDMRRRGNGEAGGFQPPTDENGNPLPPPDGFQPPAGEDGNPPQVGAGAPNDDGGASQTAPRRPRRRTATTVEQ